MHAWGLRLRRVLRTLALPCPQVLPSALLNCVGTLVAIISQLDTQPACAPYSDSGESISKGDIHSCCCARVPVEM